MAALAERLARTAGIQPPRWARAINPLAKPWYPAGTPSRRSRFVAETSPEFSARNVLLPSAVVQAFYEAFPAELEDEYLGDLVVSELAKDGVDLPAR